jgi:hypothetical protein
MKLEELFEEPLNIEDIDYFYLNDYDKNKEAYRKLNNDKYKAFVKQLADQADLFKKDTKYFCLDRKLERITYYVRYKVNRNKTLGDFVWQSLVWADPVSEKYLQNLPADVFFDIILPKTDTIITDSEQTFHGKRFWQRRISDAFNKKLNVYFYDFKYNKLIKIENEVEFFHIQKTEEIWGPSNLHKMKRIVISTKEL